MQLESSCYQYADDLWRLTKLLRKLWSGRAEVQVEFQVANGLAEYSSRWEPLRLWQMRVSIHDASPIPCTTTYRQRIEAQNEMAEVLADPMFLPHLRKSLDHVKLAVDVILRRYMRLPSLAHLKLREGPQDTVPSEERPLRKISGGEPNFGDRKLAQEMAMVLRRVVLERHVEPEALHVGEETQERRPRERDVLQAPRVLQSGAGAHRESAHEAAQVRCRDESALEEVRGARVSQPYVAVEVAAGSGHPVRAGEGAGCQGGVFGSVSAAPRVVDIMIGAVDDELAELDWEACVLHTGGADLRELVQVTALLRP